MPGMLMATVQGAVWMRRATVDQTGKRPEASGGGGGDQRLQQVARAGTERARRRGVSSR